MGFVAILRWIRGTVTFSAHSGQVERLLSSCTRQGIQILEVGYTANGFTGKTTPAHYRKMRRLARKTRVVTRITGREGLPFLIRRYRKRVGIAAGAVLFFAFLAVSQQFIWTIRIEGNERVEDAVLYQQLEALGVKPGRLKQQIDPLIVREKLVIEIDDLSWAALNIQGTTATLLVRERTPIPEKIDTDVPANVIAACDGQIKRLEVTDGITLVKEGDAVCKGDMIVSGVHVDRWGMTHLLRANAVVIAHVPETLEVRIPLLQEKLTPTGQVMRRRYLNIAGVRLPLFLYHRLEGSYKLEKNCYPIRLFGIQLPFDIERETYAFYQMEEEKISQETALQAARLELERQERQMWGESILQKDYHAAMEDGVLVLTGEYLVERDIARQVEITVLDYREQMEKEGKPVREGGY